MHFQNLLTYGFAPETLADFAMRPNAQTREFAEPSPEGNSLVEFRAPIHQDIIVGSYSRTVAGYLEDRVQDARVAFPPDWPAIGPNDLAALRPLLPALRTASVATNDGHPQGPRRVSAATRCLRGIRSISRPQPDHRNTVGRILVA